jgi:hypothetical protein
VCQAPVAAQEPPDARINPRLGIVDSFANTDAANTAGAGWTRVFFRWDVIQPGGPADWKPANLPDPLLDAEIRAGREIVGVIIGTPTWATEQGLSTAVPPQEYWGQFVFRLAAQYRGRVNRWVIWNLPDVTDPASPNHTWSGTEEDYFRLLKEAYLKIKSVDPAMKVHLAGLTYTWDEQQGNRQYLDRLLDLILSDPEAANNNYYFDAVTYHHYYDPLQLYQIVSNVRELLTVRALAQKPVWINEINGPPSEDFIEPPLQDPIFRVSLEEQSYYVIQASALAIAAGAERVAFNKLRNDPVYEAEGLPYGLLRADDSRRPAYDAFRTAAIYFNEVRQGTFQKFGEVNIVTLDRLGQTTTVMWNSGRAPVAYALNAISAQALLVTEQGEVETISTADGQYTIELPPAPCTNGDYCFIGGAPRLVVESGASSQRAALQPVETPAASQPEPAPATSTIAAPPTAVPTALPATLTTAPTVENTPVAAATVEAIPPTPLPVAPTPATVGEAPPAVLPDTDFEFENADLPEQEMTPVPPVSFNSIFRPERLLWLFVIGIIVFTIAYGVQVTIWSKFKK